MGVSDASNQSCSIGDPAIDALARLLPVVVLSNPSARLSIEKSTILTPSIEEQSDAIARRLSRTRTRHVLLTGNRGVGKTSLVWRLAHLIGLNRYPFLEGSQFLWADCSNVGPEDSRTCLESLFGIATGTDVPRVLCIDGLAALLKRPNGGSNKPLLRAFLSQPHLRLIGITSESEYAELIGSDYAMLDFFTRLSIPEPPAEEVEKIVEFHARNLEATSGVRIDDSVVERCRNLSSTFLLGGSEPRSSVSLLQQCVDDVSFDVHQLQQSIPPVATNDSLIRVLSERTGIPSSTIAGTGERIDFEAALMDAVVGQEAAIHDVANELRLIKAGLNEPGKPATVLMFAGMTGVGKTELAKRVAELYSSSKRLNTYSMGNYTEPHSVSSIIGVPPGYVGHEEGGRIVNELNADPYSVFLLDEAEKCHPNIWKPFLNLFDEGWIADQRGVRAFADRAIFILTTNAGDRNIAQMWNAAKPMEAMRDAVKQALSKVRHERASQPVFPPQFLARIRRIVLFGPLSEQAMEGIAFKKLQQMQSRWWDKRQIEIDFDDELAKSVGAIGHKLNESAQGREGGRLIARIISDHVEQPIQEALLSGKVASNWIRVRAAPFDVLSESSFKLLVDAV